MPKVKHFHLNSTGETYDVCDEDAVEKNQGEAKDVIVSYEESESSGIASWTDFIKSCFSGMKLGMLINNFIKGADFLLHVGSIVNNCVSDNEALPLSAAQGKVLMDLITEQEQIIEDQKQEITDLNNSLSNGDVTKVGTATVGSTTQPIYLNGGTPTAMSGALSTTYGGTGNTSGRSTYSNVTTTNPTSSTTYYLPWTTGISSGTNYSLNGNNGIRYNTLEGTTSDVGYGILYLGNSTASGTAGNKNGRIRIYGTDENYWTLSGNKSTTSNYTIYLPLSGGCMVVATNGSAVGSGTKPVYISSSGVATASSSTVGTTNTPMYLNSGTMTACAVPIRYTSGQTFSWTAYVWECATLTTSNTQLRFMIPINCPISGSASLTLTELTVRQNGSYLVNAKTSFSDTTVSATVFSGIGVSVSVTFSASIGGTNNDAVACGFTGTLTIS